MQHLDEGTIHAWLDGALSPDEAALVEAHVAECPQCATVVAEARGFIAASSRILTALDHVPRGVVPAAPQVQWYNRRAWRAAAAVLIVAVGSLVVVRNSEQDKIATATTADSIKAPLEAMTQSQDPTAPTSPGTAMTKLPAPHSAMPPKQSVAAFGAAAAARSSAEADLSRKSVGGASASNVAARERARDAVADTGIGGYAAAVPQAGASVTAAPRPAASVAGTTMLQSTAADQAPLKVVGKPRMIGATVTLYEIAPGDTVTFIEASNVQVDALVVTGATRAEPQARRSAAKSAAAAPTQIASPSPAGAPLQVEVANGVTTISWSDTATGNMLRLSGHMSVERLKEIKIRIERDRAAAAAKKKP